MIRVLMIALAFGITAPVFAQPQVVPFRLSRTQHIVVRVKIDGKGPFQLVVDTGCPVLLLSTEAAKKAGLEVNDGIAVIRKLDFEGGLRQNDVKARVETPFQIEGMNNMGLPGIELHGLLGYTVLAKYKMEIDMAKERMTWTPLAFDPPPLAKLKVKKGEGAGIELMGGLIKILSSLSGLKPGPPPEQRGFVGVVLDPAGKSPRILSVLDDTAAARAGLRPGDELSAINGRSVATVAEVRAAIADLRVDQEIGIDIIRGGAKSTVTLKTSRGF